MNNTCDNTFTVYPCQVDCVEAISEFKGKGKVLSINNGNSITILMNQSGEFEHELTFSFADSDSLNSVHVGKSIEFHYNSLTGNLKIWL